MTDILSLDVHQLRAALIQAEYELTRLQPLVEAAKAWARFGRDDADDEHELLKAIDALEKK